MQQTRRLHLLGRPFTTSAGSTQDALPAQAADVVSYPRLQQEFRQAVHQTGESEGTSPTRAPGHGK